LALTVGDSNETLDSQENIFEASKEQSRATRGAAILGFAHSHRTCGNTADLSASSHSDLSCGVSSPDLPLTPIVASERFRVPTLIHSQSLGPLAPSPSSHIVSTDNMEEPNSSSHPDLGVQLQYTESVLPPLVTLGRTSCLFLCYLSCRHLLGSMFAVLGTICVTVTLLLAFGLSLGNPVNQRGRDIRKEFIHIPAIPSKSSKLYSGRKSGPQKNSQAALDGFADSSNDREAFTETKTMQRPHFPVLHSITREFSGERGKEVSVCSAGVSRGRDSPQLSSKRGAQLSSLIPIKKSFPKLKPI
jgi:hypothetical protein